MRRHIWMKATAGFSTLVQGGLGFQFFLSPIFKPSESLRSNRHSQSVIRN